MFVRSQFSKLSCLSALFLMGCGVGEIRVVGNADDAKQALTQVLDAWKAGKSAADLQSGTPSVVAVDEDWTGGKQLKSYELVDSPMENGSHWRVFANLTLTTKGKTSKPEKVCYAVTLGSPTSVLRSDFLN